MAKPEELALFSLDDLQGSQTEGAPLIASPEVFEEETDIIPAIERLRILQLDDGFSPSTREELNEAFSLKAFIETRGGTARHLAEVAIHQTKYGYEPTNATKSKTRSYILYAGGARTDMTMLGTFREELADMQGQNPLSGVNKNRLSTGLGQFVRYKDLKELGETKDFSKFPFSPLRPYDKNLDRTYDPYAQTTPGPQVQARIDDVLSHTRVWEARREVQGAIAEQKNRYNFWMNRIGEIEQFQTGAIRAMASEALVRLGMKPTGA